MLSILAYDAARTGAGTGLIALVLLAALLVAGATHYVAYQVKHNHFAALLITGAAFGGTITVLVLLLGMV
jgi:hypothetical protein